MSTHEMNAWLGPALEDLSEAALERFESEWDRITADDDPDRVEDRDAELIAVLEYLLGELTVEQAGANLAAARTHLDQAMRAAKAVAVLAVEDGMSKKDAAAAGGITRPTLDAAIADR